MGSVKRWILNAISSINIHALGLGIQSCGFRTMETIHVFPFLLQISTPLVTGFLLMILGLFMFYSTNNKPKNLPPSPPHEWPILGHLHYLLPVGKNNSEDLHLRHRVLKSLSDKFGPILYLQLGQISMVVVTSSKLAKECFTEKDAIMASRPQLAGGKHMSYDNRGLVWAPYGQYWRDLRKLCILQLLSTRRIENWKHIRIEEVSDLVEFLYRRSRDRVCVNMSSKLSELSFNIIIRMVMNKRYFGPQAEDCKEARKFKELIKKVGILSGVFNLGDYIPLLRWLDLQGYERAMKELNKQKDRFLQEVLDAHKQRVGMKDAAVRDFIDVLLDREEDYLNENESLKSTVQNMIAAGTETSSLTIEWALAAVMKHPSVMRRAQNEIDSFVGCDRQVEESDLPKLKYLQAIVKETFRLYPVAPLLVPHQSTAPCTVGGYHIPAGTHLVVNAWALHRDSSVWERPLEFVPERFLEREEIDVKGKHFEMIPFGSGRRGCPGAALGLCIVQFSLARLIHSFQWSLPNGQSPQELDMTEGRGLTMPRAIPLIALPKPRLPLHLYHSNPSPQA